MTYAPVRISWSRLRVHAECKQKSWLLASGKRASGQDMRNFYHGMVVDRIMRHWLDDPGRAPGQMRAMVDEIIDTEEARIRADGEGVVRWRNAEDKHDVREFCAELCDRLEPLLYELVLPYEFENGKRFKIPIELPGPDGRPAQVILVGEMDLFVINDGPVVWDLKGTRDNSYWRKVLGQLVFYDIATWAATGQQTRMTGLIQPMCDQRVIEYTISETDRSAMVSRIHRMALDMWTEQRQCKTDWAGCSTCEVRHACPRFATNPDGTASLLRAAAHAASQETP